MDQIIPKVSEAAAKKRRHEEKIIQARIKEITSRRIYHARRENAVDLTVSS
jgi:hypothetical protein